MTDKLLKLLAFFAREIQILFKEFLLKNKREYVLFLSLFLFYLSYSYILAFDTNIIRFGWVDNYFSFDNPVIYYQGFENHESHPFFYVISRPIAKLGNYLTIYCGENIKISIWLYVTISLVSLSVIYINRYLREIIELKKYGVVLLTLFYMFFSTNLILCFTTETFTFSLFFLTLIFLSYSRTIKENGCIKLSSGLLYSFILGSVTITNTIKGVIPIVFSNENWKSRTNKIVLISLLLGSVFAIRLCFISSIFGNGFEAIFTRQQLFSGLSDSNASSFYESVVDIFLGAIIFFPDLIVVEQQSDFLFNSSYMIDVDYYHYWWQYLFIVLIYGLVIISIILNRKNKLVRVLVLFFSFELFFHVILKYGISNGFIYGGHWVYIIPLFLGWLYKAIEDKKYISYYKALLFILCLFLIVNNIIKMIDFINFSLQYYSVVAP